MDENPDAVLKSLLTRLQTLLNTISTDTVTSNEELLLQKLEGLITNLRWKPEDVTNLFSALLEQFDLTPTKDRTELHTWMLKILHCVEINDITPGWSCQTGKTFFELIWDQTVTDESLKKYLSNDSEKNLKEILNEIRQKLHQIDEETLEQVEQIVSSVEKNLVSADGNSQLYGLAIELLTVCKAVQKTKHYKPRLTQMVSWCLMALSKSGQLIQVITGEGKSCIVAMFAAFRAMKGEKVDIMSSSTVLAERDMSDWKPFYKALHISVNCNASKHDSKDLIKCYKSMVVYGTAEGFAGDWLRQNFERTDTFGQRKFQCAIVDEVDSLMLDKGLHVVYLSGKMPALQHLSPLLALIWATVNQQTEVGSTAHDAAEGEVRRFLSFTPCELQRHGNICYVPGFLRDLVNSKLKVWIENAFRAQKMTVEHEYVIERHGLVPVDYSCTGVVQNFTEWSDGLHQFLQMKHGIKLSDMNAITNYMSNVGLLQMYNDQIYGLSGTLGKQTETETLQKIYTGIKTCQIPSFKRRKLFEVEGVIAHDEEEWINTICSVVTEQINPTVYRDERAVLVICETINRAKAVSKALGDKTPNKKLYVNNNMDNSSIFKEELKAGQVIIATNLAGRGTDLKVCDQVKNAGGLFVVQTFLPNNTRVEEQAFGRTARQGFPGCAQLIVCYSHLAEKIKLHVATKKAECFSGKVTLISFQNLFKTEFLQYQNCQGAKDIKSMALALSRVLTETSDSEIKLAKKVRDCSAAKRLASYLECDIPRIKKEAELFSRYQAILDQLYKSSNNKPADSVLSALNETWGMWRLVTFNENDSTVDLKRRLDADMKSAMHKLGRSESPYANLHHYTEFGNVITGQESIEMYTKAIEADPCWAAFAYYNRALTSLAQQDRCQDRGCINQALEDLKNGLNSAHFYITQVEATHAYVTQLNLPHRGFGRFDMQMRAKSRVLGFFKEHLNGVIEKAQRAKDTGGYVKVDKVINMQNLLRGLVAVLALASQPLPAILSRDMLNIRQILNDPCFDFSDQLECFISLGWKQLYVLDTLFSVRGFLSKMFKF